jgi:hypothetical protein
MLLKGMTASTAMTSERATTAGASSSGRAAPIGGTSNRPDGRALQKAAPPALVRAPVDVNYALFEKARSMHTAAPVHDEQLRDETWAPMMETTLKEQLEKDVQRLVPGTSVEVECRTLSCRLQLVGVPEKSREDAAIALQIAPVSTLMEFSMTDSGEIVTHIFFNERNRDLAKWPRWYAESRAKSLQELRAIKQPAHPTFSNLPDK